MQTLVAYASQTGNAESIANALQKDIASRSLPVIGGQALTINSVVSDGLLEKPSDGAIRLIVVCSTTGDGDFPDNGSKFKRWAKKLSAGALAHVSFALLALGSTDYSNFCQSGRLLRETLLKLGATEFHPHAEADDATSLETVVTPWSASILQNLTSDTQAPVVVEEPDVFIAYGSQTGNALNIARLLHAESTALGHATRLLELNGLELDQAWLARPVTVVVVCSTATDGEPPSNAARFFRWLRRSALDLHQIRFAVLALGDSQYSNFCSAGRAIDFAFGSKGGSRLVSRGEADDNVGLDVVVVPWTAALLRALGGDVGFTSNDAFTVPKEAVITSSCRPIILYGAASAEATSTATLLQTLLLELNISEDPHLWPLSKLSQYRFLSRDVLVLVHATWSDVTGMLSLASFQEWIACKPFVAAIGRDCAAMQHDLCRSGGRALLDGNQLVATAREGIIFTLAALKRAVNADVKLTIEEAVDNVIMGHTKGPSTRITATDNDRQPRTTSLDSLKPTVVLHSSDNTIAANLASEFKASAPPHGISIAVTDVRNYKVVGFPRNATFVFVLGDSESPALRLMLNSVKRLVHDFEALSGFTNPPLARVKFAVLSLSQSGKHAHALELEHLLLAGGATKIHPTGLADSRISGGIDTVVIPWQQSIWAALLNPVPSEAMGYVDPANNDAYAGANINTQPVEIVAAAVPLCKVSVFYTQAGREQAAATFVANEVATLGFDVDLRKLRLGTDLLSTRFVVIVGEPKRRLLKSLESIPDSLAHLYYSVLSMRQDRQDTADWSKTQLHRCGALQAFANRHIDGLGQLERVVRPWARSVLARFTHVAIQPGRGTFRERLVSDRPASVTFVHSGGRLASLLARELWQDATAQGSHSRLGSVVDFEHLGIISCRFLVVVVCCGTEAPLDAARVLKYLALSTSNQLLRNVKIAVLAVTESPDGSTWPQSSNWIGTRLRSCGADSLMEDHCIPEASQDFGDRFNLWRENLFAAVAAEATPPLRPALSDFPLSPLHRAEDADDRVVFFFGSDHGHAEALASSLSASATKRGLNGVCASLNDFERVDWLNSSAVVVILSTGLDGVFPANASKFSRYLRHRGHPHDAFSGLKYTVLALGDSSHGVQRFCAGGKYVDRRLEELGGARFYARADADERVGFNTVAEPWISNLWSAIDVVRGPPKLSLPETMPSNGDLDASTDPSVVEEGDVPVTGKLTSWRVIANDPIRPVIHATFSVEGVEWSPGDAIRIMPTNREADCDHLCRRLGVDPRDSFPQPDEARASAPIYKRIQFPISYRDVLIRHVCLRVRNTNVISVMLAKTSDLASKEIVKRWLAGPSPEWRQILRDRTYVGELLDQIPSCRPLFHEVVEALMPLQPRSYSLCSAWSQDPTSMSICFRKAQRGVCTNWLTRLCHAQSEGKTVEVRFSLRRGGEFEMPTSLSSPLILVGPGTGIAPFIAFLQHRRAMSQRLGVPCGETHLFFGCRKEGLDFLFQHELEQFKRDAVLHGLHVAFSQEPADGVWYGGCYVQDKLLECSTHLADLIINQNSYVYVCGDADSMAHDVHNILLDTLEDYTKGSRTAAGAYLDEMQANGRYQRDIWS